MRIGIIGTGTIASAVVRGIVADGHEFTVSERNADTAAALAAAFDNVTVASNQGVIDASDVVFLGMRGNVAPGVLKDLTFRADQRVVSLMVGLSLEEIADLVAPASADALMIPFTFIAHGGSPILAFPESALLDALFGHSNTVIAMPDAAAFNHYLAAQALLSPVLKEIQVASDWLGARTGDPAAAETFLRLLIGGGLTADPLDMPGVIARMIGELSTPSGYNARLREHMGEAGVYDALIAGLDRLERPDGS
ncbi:NAD(P)-binding domain-containing protein [Rhodobium gokarnense]|uniref:Pyrroline-5-carboxylate reductase n=1 Tax=Rhodobium gokarnense TaxID=364296 RepID=A0ABT3HDN0_9HYPH|nr:NAD(P)-binding domain-containing protein [Rhodobium gokarnense]MCW2308514.1 pyrroline-5-carboxylate reductase [Rhodobium gokarnense]